MTRTLSYALMDLSWPKRPRLSAIDVLYLDRVGKARPAWLDDVPALMKRSTNPQTQVYGITMVPESVVLPRFHWHVAEVRLLSGDFHRARAQATRALELDPSLHWARLTLAVATAFDGEKARAASVLKEAAAASAGDADQHADLFAAARAIASELALPSAGLAEGDAASLLAKAEKALAAGDRKGAVAAADRARALSLQPQDFREAAQIYARARSYEKFLGLWERLLALYPRDVDIWLLRTEALILTGRPQQGARALARAEALATEPRQSAEIARYRGWLRDGPPADLAAPSSR